MALILEQMDLRGTHVVRRFGLDVAELTLGRALDRDVVLDDVHADAHHARVVRDDAGGIVLEDAHSVNGIDVPHVGRTTRLPLVAGVRFRLGRTQFRVADTSAPLPPALPLSVAPSGALPWYERQRPQLVMPVLLVGITGLLGYLSSATREAGSAALGLVLGIVAVLAIWAGVWALVGRSLVRRAAFRTHVAIVAGMFLTFWASSWILGWAGFLLPVLADEWDALDLLATVLVLLLGTVWQLGVATSLSATRRWMGALAAAALFAVLVGAFAVVGDDAFSDIPEFEGTIRYAPASLVPATDGEGFRAAISDLRAEVDSLKPRESAARGT